MDLFLIFPENRDSRVFGFSYEDKMNIYLLETDAPGWDSYLGFVVRAKTRRRAQMLCNDAARSGNWSEGTCRCLASDVKGKEGVILESFQEG